MECPKGAKLIPLNQGYFAIVDEDDYLELSKYNWFFVKLKTSIYARRNIHIHVSKYNYKASLELMHRRIMKLKKGDKKEVDHINGNGLDNRKSNLRICDRYMNNRNCRCFMKKTSKYKGVSLAKGRKVKKWYATITYNKKQIWLGSYDNEEDAANAYDAAAIKYFGEFANLNKEKNDN